MTKLTIGIIEDELLIAEEIFITLRQIGYQPLRPAHNFSDGIALIKNERPDLLLIDIALNEEKNGIDLAAELNSFFQIPFIFLTGNSDAATIERAKAVKPLAYLLKPFQPTDLFSSIEIAFNNYHANKQTQTVPAALANSIFIKESGLFHKVNLSDILFVSSENIYINLHTKERSYVARMKLDDFLAEYTHASFFRIHRSYVINLKHLETIAASSVVVGGIEVPMNKNYKDDLMQALKTLR